MNFLLHLLKFFGLLCLLSLFAQFVPFGCLVGSAVVFYALWKLVE